MARILCVGDLHLPVAHPKYLQFCSDLYDEYDCNQVIFIGDVLDWHGISFHAKHPECPGPRDEYKLALSVIREWYEVFPKALVCIGNHDERPTRLAEPAGIPASFIKDYNVIWGTEGWTWDYDFIVDNVYYFHGTDRSGIHPAFNVMKDMLMSVCMGHIHSAAGVKWKASPLRRTFSMDIGCGIDVEQFQFAYSQHVKKRPILSAGVVLDGIPYHEIMPMGPKERYHK